MSLIRQIIHRNLFPALSGKRIPHSKIITCAFCAITASQFPHKPLTSPTSLPGTTIASDTIGTIHPPSGRSNFHILTLIYTPSRFILSKLIHSRSELTTVIPETMNYILNIHGRQSMRFHSDNALIFYLQW